MNGAVSALKPRHKRASNGKPLHVVPTNHNSEVLQVQDLIMSSSSSFSSKKLHVYGGKPSFMTWRLHDVLHVAKHHWIPCVFAMGLLFFMGVEYTLRMVPSSSPPFDVGFVTTRSLHLLLASKPKLNTLLAGLNTIYIYACGMLFCLLFLHCEFGPQIQAEINFINDPGPKFRVFVGMQTTYIVWTWLVEGRPRATISALFMFTCRGILGYSTQLPLPQGFLGSGADFPVGNVSFFLFFSGHVAGSVIASLDMRRMQRWEMAWTFDALNVLQAVRLLGTRGHYTIDLAVGVGAGFLFDSLAGKYEESKRSKAPTTTGTKEAFFL